MAAFHNRSTSSNNNLNIHNEEYKASYDDLIDQYAAPYGANTNHQTYALQSSPSQHRRGPSHPLKPPFSSKQSDDDTSYDLTAVAYPPTTPPKDVDTRPFWKKILPESMACRLFVLTVLIETTIDLIVEGELLLRVHSESKGDGTAVNKTMPVYLGIFVLAHVFQFALAVDAVYARNTLQFMFLIMFNALFLVYAIIQIGEVKEAVQDANSGTGILSIPINVLTTIIPVVIAVAELAYIALGWQIHNEFGWKVYKFLGADRRIKKMYANYQIYECLVKFDVFFWVGFSVQFIWLVLRRDDWEFYVTCAALPLSLVLLVEGHLAARHENKWMMATFMSGCVSAMVYFVYKLVKVLIYKNTDDYRLTWKSLTTFSVISIILLFATFVMSVMVMQKFGRGLKESLTRKNTHQRYGSNHPTFTGPASANPNRMSID
ncbi:hypothetical protein K435DRAFT_741900 [Dendrothele bispora CBS 962.96]|uniref:Uncharacterized protein n=1 Tax=Dendrothele bispora (strain CBS 962.96) TaxID=1314807 RepID=A0A4S8MW80_DENBC|nr:hypothetical protein K435DRAFT_741900 [Dendrothele bispora CBS 962.96]